MTHCISSADHEFRRAVDTLEIPAGEFDHRAHVRLAYIYLCEQPTEQACASMKSALLAFLDHLGVDASKYHETMTRAWIMAVHHFMVVCGRCASADEFMRRNPVLLDSRIMLTHYSAELLFSPDARARFVEPDVSPIPRHG
jgi:hypothetical protein